MNLRELRLLFGLSVQAQAAALKIAPETLQRYELGEFNHIPEVRIEIQRRLRSLAQLGRARSAA